MNRRLVLLLACIGSAAVAQTPAPLSPDATRLVRDGATHLLRGCKLVARRCGGRPLVITHQRFASANDEDRSLETLTVSGLRIEAIYPLARPDSVYLAVVEARAARWSTLFGIAPGSEQARVLGRLGAPNGRTHEGCDLYVDEATQVSATLCYGGGKLARIRWDRTID